MTFSSEQKLELAKPLDPKNVASRSQAGKNLSYIEGWHAIAEANRVFGFDGWTSETLELRQLGEPYQSGDKGLWRVSYAAKVRITAGGIVREGCGFGQGIDKDVGQAHESALKEAETDSRKRALMTFGNPFGLALYDKSRANVSAPPVALIDWTQRGILIDLAKAAGMNILTVCEKSKIDRIDDLPASKFEAVEKWLGGKIDQLNINKATQPKELENA